MRIMHSAARPPTAEASNMRFERSMPSMGGSLRQGLMKEKLRLSRRHCCRAIHANEAFRRPPPRARRRAGRAMASLAHKSH